MLVNVLCAQRFLHSGVFEEVLLRHDDRAILRSSTTASWSRVGVRRALEHRRIPRGGSPGEGEQT